MDTGYFTASCDLLNGICWEKKNSVEIVLYDLLNKKHANYGLAFKKTVAIRSIESDTVY